jgi:hypothetical protein
MEPYLDILQSQIDIMQTDATRTTAKIKAALVANVADTGENFHTVPGVAGEVQTTQKS